MKIISKITIISVVLFFLIVKVNCQEIVNKFQEDTINLTDDKFAWKNKVYKKNSNYITFGGGPAINLKRKAIEQSYAVAYNFSLKNISLQAGYHVSSNDWMLNRSLQKLNDMHIGGGLRWESLKSNMTVMAGPSYAYGADQNIRNDTVFYTAFTQFGLYAEFQYTYKLFYDVGVGATAFLSLNGKYQVFGIRLEFYFSPAYRREYN